MREECAELRILKSLWGSGWSGNLFGGQPVVPMVPTTGKAPTRFMSSVTWCFWWTEGRAGSMWSRPAVW